jgi:hypothetical protein
MQQLVYNIEELLNNQQEKAPKDQKKINLHK